jgi:hypothetical protein
MNDNDMIMMPTKITKGFTGRASATKDQKEKKRKDPN